MLRLSGVSATLFACVTACGSDPVHHLPDGPMPIDGVPGTDATVAGDVTVTTLARCCTVTPGTAVAAVPVVLVQPGATVATTGMTGTDGKLTLHNVLPGAAITVVYPEDAGLNTYLATTLGVKPGDHLTYGDSYYAAPTTGTAGTMTVNLPTLANATSYSVNTPCGGASATAPTTSFVITQYTYCQTATGEISAIAYDSTGAIIGSADLPAATFANDAIVDVPAWTTNTAKNVTTSISGLAADVSVQLASFAVTDPINPQYGSSTYPTAVAGAASFTTTLPGAFARTYGYAELYRPNLDHQFSLKAGTPTATSFALTPPVLPWLDSSHLTLNQTIGKASWLQTDGTYDAAVVRIGWYHLDVAQAAHYFYWNVIVPPGLTELDFHTGAAALSGYVPTSTDSITQQTVKLIDLSTAASYDELRGVPEWQCVHPDGAVEAGEVPAADYSGGEGFTGGIARRVR